MLKLKHIILTLLFISSIFAESEKIYFYTTETNIHDFKTLKIDFDKYLNQFGNYEFQAFNNKSTFEKFLKEENIIVILSSWHYQQLAEKFNLQAKLVAQKKQSIMDKKVLVGRKQLSAKKNITAAFSKEYTKKLIDKFLPNKNINILTVPKEIDALMSVGFEMSRFALVSKDSFELLKKVNSFLADQMKIYKESSPNFRMLIACNSNKNKNKLIKIFTNMGKEPKGGKILRTLGVDNIVTLTRDDIKQLGGIK